MPDPQTLAEQICQTIEQRIVEAVTQARDVPSSEIKGWWITEITKQLTTYGDSTARAQREADAEIAQRCPRHRGTVSGFCCGEEIATAILQSRGLTDA